MPDLNSQVGDIMTPRRVPKHLMDAYENRTGFFGFGEFLEQRGRIKVITGVDTCVNVKSE